MSARHSQPFVPDGGFVYTGEVVQVDHSHRAMPLIGLGDSDTAFLNEEFGDIDLDDMTENRLTSILKNKGKKGALWAQIMSKRAKVRLNNESIKSTMDKIENDKKGATDKRTEQVRHWTEMNEVLNKEIAEMLLRYKKM
jgi:hypothetical protein